MSKRKLHVYIVHHKTKDFYRIDGVYLEKLDAAIVKYKLEKHDDSEHFITRHTVKGDILAEINKFSLRSILSKRK